MDAHAALALLQHLNENDSGGGEEMNWKEISAQSGSMHNFSFVTERLDSVLQYVAKFEMVFSLD